jgi:very-short-patch-repair endonuclease
MRETVTMDGTSDFWHRVHELIELDARMRPVRGHWVDRFEALRHNYRVYADGVRNGIVSWDAREDPYVVANWAALFTPIEAAIWSDIRALSLPFWPQFPVGKYIVDFADPVRRIALECDGAAYHDPIKDRARDAALEKMGWTTYRIPGRDCFDEVVTLRDMNGMHRKLESLRA